MIKAHLLKRNKSKSLSLRTQIGAAERELLIRQRRVEVRTATLVRNIHQQVTAPATLLLAGGLGFILGELTQRQTSGATGKLRTTGTTPLRTALNLMTSIHTLYTALPLAWLMKSFYKPGLPGQTSERQSQPTASPSCNR